MDIFSCLLPLTSRLRIVNGEHGFVVPSANQCCHDVILHLKSNESHDMYGSDWLKTNAGSKAGCVLPGDHEPTKQIGNANR